MAANQAQWAWINVDEQPVQRRWLEAVLGHAMFFTAMAVVAVLIALVWHVVTRGNGPQGVVSLPAAIAERKAPTLVTVASVAPAQVKAADAEPVPVVAPPATSPPVVNAAPPTDNARRPAVSTAMATAPVPKAAGERPADLQQRQCRSLRAWLHDLDVRAAAGANSAGWIEAQRAVTTARLRELRC